MYSILSIDIHFGCVLIVLSSYMRRIGGVFNPKPICAINFFPNDVDLRTSSVDFLHRVSRRFAVYPCPPCWILHNFNFRCGSE